MWPFRRHIPLKDCGIFEGLTDWHSHILPGVDDGVRTMEESLAILSLYESLGVRAVWLTPHIMEDIPNETAFLRQRFSELTAAYTGPIELHLSAENMLDNLFEERLEDNDLLPIGETRDHLLVETSYFSPPMGLNDILLRIKAKGFHPVLAHPERYVYMDLAKYRQLKEMDVKFQLNIPSIAGAYGDSARKKAELLLSIGLYDLTGTDTHRLSALRNLTERKITSDRSLSILRNIQ